MLAIVLIVLITLKIFSIILKYREQWLGKKKIIPFNTNEKKNVKSYLMF